jgi:hypothetical protein
MKWYKRAQEEDLLQESIDDVLYDFVLPVAVNDKVRREHKQIAVSRKAMGKFLDRLGLRMVKYVPHSSREIFIEFSMPDGGRVPKSMLNNLIMATKRIKGIWGITAYDQDDNYATITFKYPIRTVP